MGNGFLRSDHGSRPWPGSGVVIHARSMRWILYPIRNLCADRIASMHFWRIFQLLWWSSRRFFFSSWDTTMQESSYGNFLTRKGHTLELWQFAMELVRKTSTEIYKPCSNCDTEWRLFYKQQLVCRPHWQKGYPRVNEKLLLHGFLHKKALNQPPAWRVVLLFRV